MKIKRYHAADMRQALRQVRDAQGPDAVILSSRKVDGGVEVVAAVDFDAAPEDMYSQPAQPESYAARAPACSQGNVQPPRPMPAAASARPQPASRPAHAEQADFSLPAGTAHPGVNDELRTLRQMLETQLATLAWNDLTRRAPMQTELLKQLTLLGLGHDLCGELVAQLPAKLELAEAHRLALALIARRIAVAEEKWMEQGGVVAMVGPTGVGKTTLIAKLAARWVLRHGPRSIALISADAVRIGAQEQIHTLGRLLGVPAYTIAGCGELPEVLDHLADRRLVLIDTAGLSQRDPRLADELQMLRSASSRLETTLVLSAAAQAGAIEESMGCFAAAQPASCVFTKLDEATSLGGAISALIRARLPLAYLSDGQRIPEDLNPARAHHLIARAVELSRKSGATADEDLLRRRFGGIAHALA